MSIKDELRNELKDAMRRRDQRRLDVIRQVESELSVARTAPGFKGEVDDALYIQVITSYVKKMDKARQEYEGLGERAQEMAQKLAFETEYLARWLPRKLSEEETRALVRQAAAELGITDPKQAGKLVGHLMKARGKDLDGALVNRVARDELAPKA
jgi:uncharacterized protein YqeY